MARVFILSVAVLFLGAASVTEGCGFTTHSEIAHRALQWRSTRYSNYTTLINKYINDYVAGAPFPDYLYTCGKNHDAGEVGHWSPFQATAADLIRSRPQPWDEDTNRLIVFMMGVVSHFIADEIWHGMHYTPHGYGFIETVGTQDFMVCHGNLCHQAHDQSDTGGEFVAAYEVNLDWFHPLEWKVPVKDLIQIFAKVPQLHSKKIGYNVTALSIDECHALFTVGAQAVKDAAELLFKKETSRAPFMQQHYVDLPLGGIDDNAIWTTRMQDRMAEWITEGPPKNPEMLYPARHQLRKRPRSVTSSVTKMLETVLPQQVKDVLLHEGPTPQALTVAKNALHKLWHHVELETKTLPLTRQVLALFKNGNSGQQQQQQQQEQPTIINENSNSKNKVPTASTSKNSVSASASTGSTSSFLYEGQSVAVGDFDGDGNLDTVSGMHGYSEPDLPFLGTANVQFHGAAQPYAVRGLSTYGRFGFQVASVDLNMDGVDDLAVSAPFAGWDWTKVAFHPEFEYKGQVFVFFGQKGRQSFSSKPDVTITATKKTTIFGQVLTTGDVNGDGHNDLIIGSPYSDKTKGAVHVFLASKTTKATMAPSDADLVVSNPGLPGMEFGLFGMSMAVMHTEGTGAAPSTTYLLVGSPGHRNNTHVVGSVSSFAITSTAQQQVTSTLMTNMMGTDVRGQFGKSIAVGTQDNGTPVVAIGAPAADTNRTLFVGEPVAGAVYIVPATKVTAHANTTISPSMCRTVLYSSDYASRFGWQVAFAGPAHATLLASAPMRTMWITKDWHERGELMQFPTALPKGEVRRARDKAVKTASGKDGAGRFGWAFALANNSTNVVVGEPFASAASGDMVGAVHQFQLK